MNRYIVFIFLLGFSAPMISEFELLPVSDGWLVGGTLALTFMAFVGMLLSMPRHRYRHLKGTGIEGTARAMSWPETDGTAANVIGLATLRVSLPGREPYLVKQTLQIEETKRAAFTTQPLPVWVDPKDPECVFIDWDRVPTVDDMVRQSHEAMLREER